MRTHFCCLLPRVSNSLHLNRGGGQVVGSLAHRNYLVNSTTSSTTITLMRLPRLQHDSKSISSLNPSQSSKTKNKNLDTQNTMVEQVRSRGYHNHPIRNKNNLNRNQQSNHQQHQHNNNSVRGATTLSAQPQLEDNTVQVERKFADTSLSEPMKKLIPFETMSEIQAATLDAVLNGQDILAQAKTGTGKTLAFLIPAIETLRTRFRSEFRNNQVSILVISPTRELAAQISREAQPLLAGTTLGVQCVVGGTNINTELKKLNTQPCQILVATPGRLKDHLANNGLASKLSNLKFFILDEADRLLDMGFKPDIESILRSLPDPRSVDRQSMLFSATIPREVLKVKNVVLKPNHAHISTLKEEDINAHLHVPQSYLIVHLHDHLAALHRLIEEEIQLNGPKAKVMVFFPTARATGLGAEVMKICVGDRIPVYELHSRISQSTRTKVAKAFNDCQSGLLTTSDVSGRGVDYPNVTTVIQVGLPMSPEDYVHRLGRTARGGANGRGIIILAPFEEKFLTQGEIKDMPLEPYELNGSIDKVITDEALRKISDEEKDKVYQAWLGYYKGRSKLCEFNSNQLVKTANEYVKEGLKYSLDLTPGLLPKTIGLMGLKGIPGIRIIQVDRNNNNNNNYQNRIRNHRKL